MLCKIGIPVFPLSEREYSTFGGVSLYYVLKTTWLSNKENIDSSTPTGKLMLTMIGAINEFERENMLEHQKEGIAIAKKKG